MCSTPRSPEFPRIFFERVPFCRRVGPRPMHAYRTHSCGALRLGDAGEIVRLSGWVHRKRDHGQLMFVDLRDHYGITQCVLDSASPDFERAAALRLESVITVTGKIVARSAETVNAGLPTGEIELQTAQLVVQTEAEPLPFPVNTDAEYPEEMRLKYRFLDLRREAMHRNIVLRSQVVSSIRRRMIAEGFLEYQTPILTSSSPEGARDFLVPSRLHPGQFYALPQSPQQSKQLLMVAGFDRYFQISACFRDEAARADLASGDFYQLRHAGPRQPAGPGRCRRSLRRFRVRGLRQGAGQGACRARNPGTGFGVPAAQLLRQAQ